MCFYSFLQSVSVLSYFFLFFFFFQAEDGIRDVAVTGVQTFALPISLLVLLRRRPVTIGDKLAFLGGLALVVVLQGYSNALINHQWGYSFAERLGAMLHPQRLAVESGGYPSNPPWHYLLTLLAALIPPASILLLAAAVQGGRQIPLLGIATLEIGRASCRERV